MSFSLSGSTITQTGTDTDLSGLAGIAGVTTLIVGTGVSERSIYSIGNRALYVNGTLNINPEIEAVYAGVSSPSSTFRMAGTLNINGEIIENGVTRYSTRLCIWSPRPHGAAASARALDLMDGSTTNWTGGVISVNSAILFSSSAILETTGATLIMGNNGDNQIRQSCKNWTCNSFKLFGTDLTLIAVPVLFNGYEPVGCKGALAFSSATPNIDFPIGGYVSNGSNEKDIKFWQGCRPIVTNSATGSGLNAGSHIGAGNAYGVAIVRQEVEIHITDAIGANVLGAKIYTIDTDNGNRGVYNKEGHVVNNIDNKIYMRETIVTGKTSVYAIDIAYNVVNTGNSDGVNVGNYAWDYRGNNNNNSDLFTFKVSSYNHALTSFSSVLKGTNALQAGTTVFDDLLITETTKATVDAYTEIDTTAKFYDRAKSFLVDNYAGESSTILTHSGINTDTGSYNVIINATAGSVFAFDETTITIKASTFTGNIKTTGTVTLSNGATIAGFISHAEGDSNISVTVPTGYDNDIDVYANQTDAENEVNQIATGASFTYPSATYGGTTLWFRMTQIDGSYIIENYLVPAAAGNYEISLVVTSENAALGSIKAVTDRLDSMLEIVSGNQVFKATAVNNVSDTIKPDLQVLNRNQIKLGAFKKVTELI